MTEDIQISIQMHIGVQQPPPNKQLYRVLHDVELPTGIRPCQPCAEVHPLDGLRSPFGKSWQILAFALNKGMTGGHFRTLYGAGEAFANGTGFPQYMNGKTIGKPHADYVNNKDLTYSDPAFDKSRLCGGATITGVEDGTDLIVDVLDSTNPAPPLEDLLQFPTLYFHAVICSLKHGIQRFPQMLGQPVLVPLIGRQGSSRYPLAALQKVDAVADPYYIGYRPSPYV